jgi:hypothetical protein
MPAGLNKTASRSATSGPARSGGTPIRRLRHPGDAVGCGRGLGAPAADHEHARSAGRLDRLKDRAVAAAALAEAGDGAPPSSAAASRGDLRSGCIGDCPEGIRRSWRTSAWRRCSRVRPPTTSTVRPRERHFSRACWMLVGRALVRGELRVPRWPEFRGLNGGAPLMGRSTAKGASVDDTAGPQPDGCSTGRQSGSRTPRHHDQRARSTLPASPAGNGPTQPFDWEVRRRNADARPRRSAPVLA